MFCNKCGNELNEEDLFCPKCGNKVENQSKETKSFEQQGSEEYKSKLKLANDAADVFLKDGQHNIFRYNQICAMYGELEQIGSHIPSTYIDELDFFVKANLLDNGVYFNTVESFEKTFDEILRLALSNINTDEEKNALKLKYIKPKILSEYEEKLQNKKKKRKQEMRPFTSMFLGLLIIAGVFFVVAIVHSFIVNKKMENESKNSSYNYSSTNKVQYGDTKYESSIYGEKVVKAYYSKYGITSDIGKITSITESQFLEKDNYGRYAFKVTFKYNPENKAGDTMLDRESTKTVIAIYFLNLDDPDGLYIGVQNVRELYYTTWIKVLEDIKNGRTDCGGKWNSPLTIKFTSE